MTKEYSKIKDEEQNMDYALRYSELIGIKTKTAEQRNELLLLVFLFKQWNKRIEKRSKRRRKFQMQM